MDDQIAADPDGPPGSADARVDMRDSLFLYALMRLSPDDVPVPLRVRNLSASGMMADCAAPVEQGQEVEIGLRNIGAVPGRIVWVQENQIGITFDNRIDPRVARQPVGLHATEAMLVKPVRSAERRPGLKIKYRP